MNDKVQHTPSTMLSGRGKEKIKKKDEGSKYEGYRMMIIEGGGYEGSSATPSVLRCFLKIGCGSGFVNMSV